MAALPLRLNCDPVLADRHWSVLIANTACTTASKMWPQHAFHVAQVAMLTCDQQAQRLAYRRAVAAAGVPMYECDNCGYTANDAEGINPCQDLHERLDFPVGHPDCIMPAGDCLNCGAFVYTKVAQQACNDCGAEVATITGCPDGAEVCADCLHSH